jgi:hypothetical protein
MEETSIWQEKKDLLNNIAGHWYAEAADQTLIFSFCIPPAQEAALMIIEKNKPAAETVYSVGSYLGENIQSIYYIDMGAVWDKKRWYKIKEITSSKMLLTEIEKAAGRKEISSEF